MAALAAGAVLFARLSYLTVLGQRNGEFLVTRYNVLEEDFNDPKLRELRRREGLDKVVAGAPTQFDAAVRLRKWARSQWEPGSEFYYPPWDASEILDLARRHGNRGFCAQYAIVFLQACLSMGIHARYVDLPGHFAAAIWSDDYDKWVLMDPLNDLHYERGGMPLSERQLCMAYWSKDIRGISRVGSDGARKPVSLEDLRIYRKYSIILRNNHLSAPVRIVWNGRAMLLAHRPDYRSYPHIGRDMLLISDVFLAYRDREATEFFTNRPYSEDPDDFRHDENQTIIYFAGAKYDKSLVKLVLIPDDSPTFRTFQASVDGGPWRDTRERGEWKLHPGINKFSARIVTRFGWNGRESYLKVFYKPSWFPAH